MYHGKRPCESASKTYAKFTSYTVGDTCTWHVLKNVNKRKVRTMGHASMHAIL